MDVDATLRPDQVSLGVLVSSAPRDAVDAVIAGCGVGAKRSDGKLAPQLESADALIVRSAVLVTAELLEDTRKLRVKPLSIVSKNAIVRLTM